MVAVKNQQIFKISLIFKCTAVLVICYLCGNFDLIVGLKSQSKSKNSSRSNLNLANLIAAF